MQVLKKVTVEKNEIEDVKCDRCGCSCRYDLATDLYNLNALFVDGMFGYGSNIDGINIRFELCEKCVVEIVSEFKIPPRLRNTLDGNSHVTVEELRERIE